MPDSSLTDFVFRCRCVRKGRGGSSDSARSVLLLPEKCPPTCDQRKNCSSCLSSSQCVWCEQTRECFLFSVYTSKFFYGGCLQWKDSLMPTAAATAAAAAGSSKANKVCRKSVSERRLASGCEITMRVHVFVRKLRAGIFALRRNAANRAIGKSGEFWTLLAGDQSVAEGVVAIGRKLFVRVSVFHCPRLEVSSLRYENNHRELPIQPRLTQFGGFRRRKCPHEITAPENSSLLRCRTLVLQVPFSPFAHLVRIYYRQFQVSPADGACPSCPHHHHHLSNASCSSCLKTLGCGWRYRQEDPAVGKCLRGDFENPSEDVSNEKTMEGWAYLECPDVDECAKGTHNCHQNGETLCNFITFFLPFRPFSVWLHAAGYGFLCSS